MYFKQLGKVLSEKRNTGNLMSKSEWPNEILIESNVLNKLKEIEKYTNKESFLTRNQGAVGWEYGLHIYFLVDEVFPGKPISGTYNSVSVSEQANVATEFNKNRSKVKFILNIGGSNQKTKDYDSSILQERVEFFRLATFHTHPKNYMNDGTHIYTFFSIQDVFALLRGNIMIEGLLSGKDIWLMCKTSESKMISPQLLSEATREEMLGGTKGVIEFVKNNLNDFGIVFYQGSFGSKLRRL